MTVLAHKTPAYGQWRVIVMVNGAEHEGWGLTEQQATVRAHARAKQEPCEGCGRPVSPAEAAVSRQALGAVFCATCRAQGTDDTDYFKEDR